MIIAGAGIAGLTLGRCLAKTGISCLILEKYKFPQPRGSGITLHSWAYRSLLQVLQIDELTFRQKVAVDTSRGGIGLISNESVPPEDQMCTGTFRCHLGKLRGLLREGLDIRWDHQIDIVKNSDGTTAVHVRDKEPIEAMALIGTDGVHSQVRKSLAPNIELKVLPYVVFNGKRTISTKQFQDILAPQMQLDTIIESRLGDIVLQIAIDRFTHSKVDLSYTYSRPIRGPNDSLHRPNRPTSGSEDISDDFYLELEGLQGLNPAFADIFDVEKVMQDRLRYWLMRTALGSLEDYQTLADQNVLLLGDSSHAMPILGGQGANFATKDGVELAEHIAAHGMDGIKTFLNARFDAWKEGVNESKRRIAAMHGLSPQ